MTGQQPRLSNSLWQRRAECVKTHVLSSPARAHPASLYCTSHDPQHTPYHNRNKHSLWQWGAKCVETTRDCHPLAHIKLPRRRQLRGRSGQRLEVAVRRPVAQHAQRPQRVGQLLRCVCGRVYAVCVWAWGEGGSGRAAGSAAACNKKRQRPALPSPVAPAAATDVARCATVQYPGIKLA